MPPRTPLTVAALVMSLCLLAGCASSPEATPEPSQARDDAPLAQDASPSDEPAPEPEMPAATAAEFPGGVHGSGSTTVTSQDGFVATVRWDWSDLVRIPTDDVPLVVPECADRVRIGLTGSSATDGAAYVLRIRSSVAYPEIAGFTWPANLTLGLAMESLYDPGFNADHGQPVCGTIGTQTPDVVTLTGPPGGDTTTFIAWVVGRTPKNPDAILTPGDVQVGLAESVDRTQLTGTELTVAGAFATCDPSCHFDLDVPLPR